MFLLFNRFAKNIKKKNSLQQRYLQNKKGNMKYTEKVQIYKLILEIPNFEFIENI